MPCPGRLSPRVVPPDRIRVDPALSPRDPLDGAPGPAVFDGFNRPADFD